MTSKINQNITNTLNQLNDTQNYLIRAGIIAYYNVPSLLENKDGTHTISWNSHVSGMQNCGSAFTELQQYQHILSNNSYNCILFDGSIIRTSFTFDKNKLLKHSHLWWPAPYKITLMDKELGFADIYDDFISDPMWVDKLRMRSPIRIDFDSLEEREGHPSVHMHIQHHETRISVNTPICFNGFIEYILLNFYPDIDLNQFSLTFNKLSFLIDRRKLFDKEQFKIII